MSTARAECVIAPDETYSAPVSAYSRTLARVMPPETSTSARPAIWVIAARTSDGVKLSSKIVSRTGGHTVFQLGKGADFNLDWQVAVSKSFKSRPHAACRGDVVVLDENGVIQPHPVVPDAAGSGRELFKAAQSRGRLAGVENLTTGTLYLFDVPCRERGDTTEALHEVQSGSLQGKQALRGSRYASDDIVGINRNAAFTKNLKFFFCINLLQQLDTGDHKLLAC